MAQDLHRHPSDAALDALAALDAAERELRNWRAHLERMTAAPTRGIGLQAVHTSRVVAAVVAQAGERTAEAALLAHASETSLRSVS